MAQTTGAVSYKAATLEYTTGATWTDIAGTFTKVTITGYDRIGGQAFTPNADIAIITSGKLNPLEATFTMLYTESSIEAWPLLWALHISSAVPATFFRFTIKGSTVPNTRFTSDAGYLVNVPVPAGDAASGDPVAVDVVFRTPKFTSAALT